MADIPSSRPRFTPELVETTTRSTKRFTPQPIEHTARSSRQTEKGTKGTSTPKSRFLPQPVETSTTTSESRQQKNAVDQQAENKGRFRPVPLETTTRSNREKVQEKAASGTNTPADKASPKLVRRITPQLIATSKHTRKVTFSTIEERRQLPLPDRLRSLTLQPLPTPEAPVNSPAALLSPEISEKEARRLGIPLPKRRLSLDLPTRTHSFRAPDLDTIASSESNSSVPSRSASTSPSSTSEESYRYKRGGWRRYSDAGTPGDVLLQAAKAAERQLREQAQEQALAAFVNDDRHVPVSHFIGHESVAPSAVPSPRQGSYAENFHRKDTGKWDSDLQYLEMRKFQEKREAQREKERQDKEKRRRRMARQMSDERNFASPWSNPFSPRGARLHSVHVGPTPEELEMERMRNNARPPMLGKDIVFPRCASPDSARFDVTQGSWSVRNKMCYLTEQTSTGQEESSEDGGLWSPKPTKPSIQIAPLPSRGSTRGSSPGGLWGGVCHQNNTAQNVQFGPSGLMTPRVEGENPMEMKGAGLNRFMGGGGSSQMSPQQLPPSPPPSATPSISTLSAKLEAEKAIEAEFDDAFVSQIYNYLSLGYANIGRKYDDELAKISRMDVSELRADDETHPAKGYLGVDDLYEGPNVGGLGTAADGTTTVAVEERYQCARFKALKKYVHEWARQQPGFANGGNTGGFGVAIRRGSWAI